MNIQNYIGKQVKDDPALFREYIIESARQRRQRIKLLATIYPTPRQSIFMGIKAFIIYALAIASFAMALWCEHQGH